MNIPLNVALKMLDDKIAVFNGLAEFAMANDADAYPKAYHEALSSAEDFVKSLGLKKKIGSLDGGVSMGGPLTDEEMKDTRLEYYKSNLKSVIKNLTVIKQALKQSS